MPARIMLCLLTQSWAFRHGWSCQAFTYVLGIGSSCFYSKCFTYSDICLVWKVNSDDLFIYSFLSPTLLVFFWLVLFLLFCSSLGVNPISSLPPLLSASLLPLQHFLLFFLFVGIHVSQRSRLRCDLHKVVSIPSPIFSPLNTEKISLKLSDQLHQGCLSVPQLSLIM